MSQEQNHAHETHASIVNKIKKIKRIIIQICRVCKLTSRSCYVIAEMFDKCVFCVEIEKIIKQCDVTSHNYISSTIIFHLSMSSKNDVLSSSFDSTNVVFSALFFNLLNDAFVSMSIDKSNNVLVFNFLNLMKDVVVFKQYNSSTNDFHFFSFINWLNRTYNQNDEE
jgi:hypothetical protein